jgi:hypothetical protein
LIVALEQRLDRLSEVIIAGAFARNVLGAVAGFMLERAVEDALNFTPPFPIYCFPHGSSHFSAMRSMVTAGHNPGLNQRQKNRSTRCSCLDGVCSNSLPQGTIPEFPVHNRHELIERFLLAAAPGAEKSGDLARSRRRHRRRPSRFPRF